ncbi:hypothetical protein CEXT_553991 [Caerostris extrusa]|uniref:Uncharacterized protein n=1 Tax=Caerostris extrusa TaxID=172846 RepID=A0AAV4PBH0_CAEEX|nr:hypothetical protein CEXT_553991 [Caerostris extrusa]
MDAPEVPTKDHWGSALYQMRKGDGGSEYGMFIRYRNPPLSIIHKKTEKEKSGRDDPGRSSFLVVKQEDTASLAKPYSLRYNCSYHPLHQRNISKWDSGFHHKFLDSDALWTMTALSTTSASSASHLNLDQIGSGFDESI